MKKKLVIFDFDGTLMDTNELILNSWQHAFRHFEGKERDEKEIYATFGETLVHSMEYMLPDVPVDEAVEKYREYQYAHCYDEVRLFDGIRELLEELKEKGMKMGIVTSRLRNTTMKYLDLFELADYFDYVVTCDDTKIHKPEPEPALVVLRELGISAEEAIMLGDTKFDIGCANNAGIDSVWVNWGVAYHEDEYVPKYVIGQPKELLEVI